MAGTPPRTYNRRAMRPVRFWFNGGYADFQVPEGSDDGFHGNAMRVGADKATLRISVMRTRPAKNGGPASADEALRLTRFASVGTLAPLPNRRAVLSHRVAPSEDEPDLLAHVWHLAVPAPEASILVAIFSLEVAVADAERPETRATVETIGAQVHSASFVFFDEKEGAAEPDLEDA